ncbi:jg16867 [Pararge aegeria aegeria]|uniref:Jg16867 protein n=1 Tax=Pararge aegeria aegeria TaxID=348720 RepID=A0A8S4SNR3_9NEOP|nr:jg16867 [Pararge aegeria aegeria]
MQFLNPFVLVFLHIAVSMLELSRGCRRSRKHCQDAHCFPCNHFSGPKLRASNTKVQQRFLWQTVRPSPGKYYSHSYLDSRLAHPAF